MKYFKNILFMMVFVIGLTSCTDDFNELNTDQTSLTEDTIDLNTIGLFFAQSQYSAMAHTPLGPVSFYPWRFQTAQSLFPDLYVQYFATTASYFESDTNVIVGAWNGFTWESFYSYCAPQIKFFEDFTSENELIVENAIAKVWKVFAYNRTTDFYGPIPFSQFGNGETSVPYDSQEDVYKLSFTILDEAVEVLKANSNSTTILSDSDGIYRGDPAKWLTFANTLRLRMALRIKYAEPALAKSEAEKAVADGVMENNTDNAMLYTNGSSSKNGLNVVSAWSEFRMSAAMESVLKGYEDPRLPELYSPAANGDGDGDGIPYEGILNGQTVADRSDAGLDFNGSSSNMGPRFLPEAVGDGTPIRVIRAAEAYLLRAEGALEGWNMGGTAQSLYDQGINTSLDEWGTPDASFTSSTNTPAPVGNRFDTPALSDVPVAYDASASTERQLEQIMTQKWIALYPDSWESWADVRRTGYPTLYSRLVSVNPDVPVDMVMRRMTFVSQEYELNEEALNAALALPEMSGGDIGSTKLWWDKK
ncbi:MAG: SusD/RagB family nutrient-binding outer membrane lipoprotein [Flavobacteriaceae bacterium]